MVNSTSQAFIWRIDQNEIETLKEQNAVWVGVREWSVAGLELQMMVRWCRSCYRGKLKLVCRCRNCWWVKLELVCRCWLLEGTGTTAGCCFVLTLYLPRGAVRRPDVILKRLSELIPEKSCWERELRWLVRSCVVC